MVSLSSAGGDGAPILAWARWSRPAPREFGWRGAMDAASAATANAARAVLLDTNDYRERAASHASASPPVHSTHTAEFDAATRSGTRMASRLNRNRIPQAMRGKRKLGHEMTNVSSSPMCMTPAHDRRR